MLNLADVLQFGIVVSVHMQPIWDVIAAVIIGVLGVQRKPNMQVSSSLNANANEYDICIWVTTRMPTLSGNYLTTLTQDSAQGISELLACAEMPTKSVNVT